MLELFSKYKLLQIEKQTSSEDPTETPTPQKKKRVRKTGLACVNVSDGAREDVRIPEPSPSPVEPDSAPVRSTVTAGAVSASPLVQRAPAPARSAVTASAVSARTPAELAPAPARSAVTASAVSAHTPAQDLAPARSAVTAGTVDNDSSASSHAIPAWRSRKAVPVGGQKSVEDLLSILERRPVRTAPVRPRAALEQVETEDNDSEDESGDENDLKLDGVSSESGHDDNENLEGEFICDDNE